MAVEGSTWAPLPAKFEAGTPHIAGAVGLHTAIDFLAGFDQSAVAAHEHDLLTYATERLGGIAGVRLIGTAREKASVLSFTVAGVHPHDLGTVLDAEGVCIRAGHHCAQPLMRRLGLVATARASFSIYNTRDDVDALAAGVEKAKRLLA